jgi:hypothetical protein
MKGVYLEAELLRSEALRGLTRWSILVYLRFLQKRVLVQEKHKSKSATYRIANNGEIVFPYREASRLGISERNFRNSIDELQKAGLLDITRLGKGGRSGESTLYWIDTRWKHYGTDRFQPPKKPRIKDTVQGRGWATYNAKNKLKPADKKDSATADKTDSSLDKKRDKRMTKMTAVKNDEIYAIN